MKNLTPSCETCVHTADGYMVPCKRVSEWLAKHRTMAGFDYCQSGYPYKGEVVRYKYYCFNGVTK